MNTFYLPVYEPAAEISVINLDEGIIEFGFATPIEPDEAISIGVISAWSTPIKLADWNNTCPPLLSPKAQAVVESLGLPLVDLVAAAPPEDFTLPFDIKALHCRSQLDCIDYERSEFLDGGPLIGVKRLVLKESAIQMASEEQLDFFCPVDAVHLLIVSARIAEALAEAGLSGLKLVPFNEFCD